MNSVLFTKLLGPKMGQQKFTYFWCLRILDLPTPRGMHFGFAWICFNHLGLKLKFFSVDGGFPHSPGSTGSGHFLFTIVSKLGSYCKFSPLISLLDNCLRVRFSRVRTTVCTPWITGLGTPLFSVRYVTFFSVLKKEHSVLFRSFPFFFRVFGNFWNPKERSVLF